MCQARLVVLTALLGSALCMPLLVLPPRGFVPWSIGTPGFIAVRRYQILLPPDSNAYNPANGAVVLKSAVIPGDLSQNQTARLPTVGDIIEFLPFLPIEINVPDMFHAMANFWNWMFNRNPNNSTGRIYILVDQRGDPMASFIPQPIFLP